MSRAWQEAKNSPETSQDIDPAGEKIWSCYLVWFLCFDKKKSQLNFAAKKLYNSGWLVLASASAQFPLISWLFQAAMLGFIVCLLASRLALVVQSFKTILALKYLAYFSTFVPFFYWHALMFCMLLAITGHKMQIKASNLLP